MKAKNNTQPELPPLLNGGESAACEKGQPREKQNQPPPEPQVLPTATPTSSPPLTMSECNASNGNQRAMLSAMVRDPSRAKFSEESGYIIKGRFITQHEVADLIKDHPNEWREITKHAKKAVRIGTEVKEVSS